jgi:hypothetical protein
MAKNTKGPTPDGVISAATPGDRRARSRGGNHCPSRWADLPRVRRESDGIVPSLPGRIGGQQVTKAKLRQLKRAAKRPRLRSRTKRAPPP